MRGNGLRDNREQVERRVGGSVGVWEGGWETGGRRVGKWMRGGRVKGWEAGWSASGSGLRDGWEGGRVGWVGWVV